MKLAPAACVPPAGERIFSPLHAESGVNLILTSVNRWKEEKMYGYKFRDYKRFGEIGSPAMKKIAREMQRADRSYLRNNLDPSSEGNYLEDFLRVHGDEDAVPVKFYAGNPHAEGRGLVCVDLAKERRRIEDRLRKSPRYLAEMMAMESTTFMLQ
jgi:hypothetical protein